MGHGEKFEQLRERAVALRRAGRSRREIKALLGITSNATLDKALRGEPPPEWTRRPNAKDELRAKARELHGCLRIDVLDSAGLYRRIEGWARAALDARDDSGSAETPG